MTRPDDRWGREVTTLAWIVKYHGPAFTEAEKRSWIVRLMEAQIADEAEAGA